MDSEGGRAFRLEVATRFREAINQRHLTIGEAALDLGVSRQSLHQYLAGKTAPKGPVLHQACRKWGITLDYKGLKLGASAFQERAQRPVKQQQQLLFDALTALSNDNLRIKLTRKDAHSVHLDVEIKFAS